MTKSISPNERGAAESRIGTRLEVPTPPVPGSPSEPVPAPPLGPDLPGPSITDPVPAESPAPVREPPVMPTPMARRRDLLAHVPALRVAARNRHWAGAALTVH